MAAKVDACSIAAGDTIVLDFKESEGASGRAIENEHFGPITAYMAPAASQGDGAVWFKVFEQGFDASTDMWAINILNENDGLVEVTIPADIKAGDYILRGEVLALHQADKGIYELYPNCVLLTVTGGGSAEPEGVDLEVIYNDPDTYPGLLWNPFNGKNAGYLIPGPAVYEAGAVEPANIKANIQPSSSSASTTEEKENDGPTENNSNTKSNTSKAPCINGKRRVERRRRRRR
ncbi:hypothetical protein LPJ57_001212 [Coemansia sp. RSA 486]|nr:hypothetical protein LPJ57_001212 [Coemansia sp. RSA 486]KAJ2235436.1 hypothetical protein IWW45_002604 [Coemansia sp. RSA 485]